MKIFKKLFRRSSSSNLQCKDENKKTKKKKNKSKKGKRRLFGIGSKKKTNAFEQGHGSATLPQDGRPPSSFPTTHAHPDDVIRKPSFNTSAGTSSDSARVSHSYSSSSGGDHSGVSPNEGRNDTNTGVIESDDNYFHANFPESNDNVGRKSNRLDYDKVQMFEQSMKQQNPVNQLYQSSNKSKHLRLYNGELVAANNAPGFGSPLSASSEFDLSTDAEDNDYNDIRRAATGNLAPMLEPTSDCSEDETSIGLNTIRNPRTESIKKNQSYLSNSDTDDEPVTLHNMSSLYFSGSDVDDENQQLTSGESNSSPNLKPQNDSITQEAENNESNGNTKPLRFVFDPDHNDSQMPRMVENNPNELQQITAITSSGSQDKSLLSTLSPRTIAIQQAQSMRAQGKLPVELYPDSTDSEFDMADAKRFTNKKDMLPPIRKKSEDSTSSGSPRQGPVSEGVIENFADFGRSDIAKLYPQGSKSVTDPTSPVSELLQKAKARRNNRHRESSSVNSAPIDNIANLRQYHNLSQTNKGQRSSITASSAAKEKLRRRRREKEQLLKVLNHESDEGSDKGGDANESWLIDEVTGALGPRHIAADLESLGGRSNRSKTSAGNRSHKSYRSHKSQKSNRSGTSNRSRRKRSDESVGSRISRGSRYSLKSSGSHMSEQSRSVANDLLRLEMQLARVSSKAPSGPVEKDGNNRRSPKEDNGYHGMKSQHARTRTPSRPMGTMPKRVKLTVIAPAGKLGIILANKTDAKGTVVSGVRTTSVLADRVSPGDRILAIDDEDVSKMTVSEITAIMARKSDFERALTVLTTAQDMGNMAESGWP